MVHALSLAPFCSLSPSASQSQSQYQSSLASHHSLCLVYYSIPQSKSRPHRITKKPKPPSTTTNYPSNTDLGEILMRSLQQHCKEKGKLEQEERKQHRKFLLMRRLTSCSIIWHCRTLQLPSVNSVSSCQSWYASKPQNITPPSLPSTIV